MGTVIYLNTSCTFGLIQKYQDPSDPTISRAGIKAVRSKPKTGVENRNSKNPPERRSVRRARLVGFINNKRGS
jgi:hypothetical protein